MIFSHAPAGFLVVYFTRKFWAKNLAEKQINLLYILGAVFGIFPDLDALYFYFFNASLRHRELITHSFIFYIIIFIALYSVARFIKNNFLKSFSFVFFVSTLSHLLLDSLGVGVMWLYPFKTYTYGLLNFNFLAAGWFGRNIFFIDMFLEIVLFLVALNFVFYKFFKKYFKISLMASYAFFVFSLIFLYILWPHSYSGRANFYYKDKDFDGIINMRDLDLDGDKTSNIRDIDADGDGVKNIEQILKTGEKIEGKWYDKTEGGLWEIPTRFGLLAKIDVVQKSYEEAGIFFKQESTEDFKKHPYLYQGTPRDALFDRKIYNLFVFLGNNDMLIDGKKKMHGGDIVFYGEAPDYIGLVMSLGAKEKPRVLIMDDGKAVIIYNQETIQKFGEIKAIGRMKYKNK